MDYAPPTYTQQTNASFMSFQASADQNLLTVVAFLMFVQLFPVCHLKISGLNTCICKKKLWAFEMHTDREVFEHSIGQFKSSVSGRHFQSLTLHKTLHESFKSRKNDFQMTFSETLLLNSKASLILPSRCLFQI